MAVQPDVQVVVDRHLRVVAEHGPSKGDVEEPRTVGVGREILVAVRRRGSPWPHIANGQLIIREDLDGCGDDPEGAFYQFGPAIVRFQVCVDTEGCSPIEPVV